MNKKIMIITLFSLVLSLSSCGNFSSNFSSNGDVSNSSTNSENSNSNNSSTPTNDNFSSSSDTILKPATFTKVHPVSYSSVNVQKDMNKFYSEVLNSNGTSHDSALDYGFVTSVWHTLKINNTDVAVYSARCGTNVHSFAYVDIETDGLFSLDVKLTLSEGNYSKVTVLPEKEGIVATYNNRNISATIDHYGNFSFVFDENPYMAITLYVASYSKLEVPSGYSKVDINPGTYDNTAASSLNFTQAKTVYNFKAGVYDITSITLPSNSIAFFERGCYMRVFETTIGDYTSGLSSTGSNVKILGRVLFDFSKCIGGDAKTKRVYDFSGNDIYIEGITTINSCNWSMCFNAAKNVEVSKCMFFSYRTYSDGIMFSDCQDCYAHDNFVRTGDDAMEVKSFTSMGLTPTKNVVFENNSAWTDKGLAYGCVYEAYNDVGEVYFKNNSVGFAQASWSEHLGCLVMQMGNNKNATWEKVYFENIEIFKTACSAITIYNKAANSSEGGRIRNIEFKNVTVKYADKKNSALPPYGINIVIRLGDGVLSDNAKIGTIKVENLVFESTKVNKNNYNNYTSIKIDANASFNSKSLVIN